MKDFSKTKSRQEARFTLALALAVGALLLLLGAWGSLAPAQAMGQGSGYALIPALTGTLTRTVYLPFVRMDPTPTATPTPTPGYIFFDDFSNPNSGWPVGSLGDICSFRYKDGRYEVTVNRKNERCIIPAFPVPKTPNGTFSVKVRRTSSSDRPLLYGFFFGAGTDANRDRWALEVRPDAVQCDGKLRGFYWLSAREDNKDKYFDNKCSSDIKTDRDRWNELTVVRQGSKIKIYVNGDLQREYDKGYLLNKGFFDLEVISLYDGTSTSKPVIVEFDDFLVK